MRKKKDERPVEEQRPELQPPELQPLLTLAELEEILRCKRRFIHELIEHEGLPFLRWKGEFRFERSAIAHWLQTQQRRNEHGRKETAS